MNRFYTDFNSGLPVRDESIWWCYKMYESREAHREAVLKLLDAEICFEVTNNWEILFEVDWQFLREEYGDDLRAALAEYAAGETGFVPIDEKGDPLEHLLG